jgi:hypothetical protein
MKCVKEIASTGFSNRQRTPKRHGKQSGTKPHDRRPGKVSAAGRPVLLA